ncbi:MAG: hypothetical protein Q7I93_06175, partial [Syntrophales bacterium]|nr:hypothetical protein [Syntrophales bacterium]
MKLEIWLTVFPRRRSQIVPKHNGISTRAQQFVAAEAAKRISPGYLSPVRGPAELERYTTSSNKSNAFSSTGFLEICLLKSSKIVPLAPLPERQRIVAILDEAFAAIATAKQNAGKNLQNARELFESYLQSVFANPSTKLGASPGDGWERCNLEDYIKFIDYRGRTPEKTESGMRLITAKNVRNGYLQIKPREYVHPSIYKTWMTRGIPKIGDVLFTTEAPLANVAQLDTEEKVVF